MKLYIYTKVRKNWSSGPEDRPTCGACGYLLRSGGQHPQDKTRTCSETVNACKPTNCRYCPIIDKSGMILSTSTGKRYYAKRNVTSKSTNPIYCISCKQCKKQYVGQTGGTLMDRFKAHFSCTSRQDMKEAIGRHFNGTGHSSTSDLLIHVLDFIHAPDRAGFALDMWLQVEYNWMQALKTMLPMGLNTMDRAPTAQYCRDVTSCTSRNKIVEVNLQVP